MTINFRKTISYAELNGWTLDYFDSESAILSRRIDRDSIRKKNVLGMFAGDLQVKFKEILCDDYMVVCVGEE